jgi:hypothetical protein
MSFSIQRLSSLVLLVVALAGCGGQGGPSGQASAPDASPTPLPSTPVPANPSLPSNPLPRAWLDAERLDLDGSGSALNMRLALNRQGAGMVVWEHREGSAVREVHARAVSINHGHGATTSLGTGIAAFPDVAVDEQGRALAVWVEGVFPSLQIMARSFHPDTGWGTQTMSSPAGVLVSQPRAAVNDAGEMAVVWRQIVDVTPQVHARRFSPTQGWSAAVRLDSVPYEAWTPQVSLDADGRLLSTWYQSNAANGLDVWANHIEPGGTPATAVQIDPGTGYSDQPVQARLGDGSTLAVWRQTNETQDLNQRMGMNRFQPGTGWTTASSASGAQTAIARSAYLAPWGAAHAVTAWVRSSNGSRTEVWANRIQQGQPGEPQALQGGQTLAQDDARIGADDLGNAIGMWTRRDGAALTLWATLWPASGAPGTAQRLDNSASSLVSASALGVDAQGQALAVWVQTEGDRDRLWVRPYRAP